MAPIEGVAEVVLAVTDLPLSRVFYGDALGLPIVRSERERVWLAAGPTLLGLWRAHPDEGGASEAERLAAPRQHDDTGAEGGRHVHLALRVGAGGLDALLARLADRHVEVREVRAWAPGARSAFVDDPDGNVIELTDAPSGALTHEAPSTTLRSGATLRSPR